MAKLTRLFAVTALYFGCVGTVEEAEQEPAPPRTSVDIPGAERINGTVVLVMVGSADLTSATPEYYLEKPDGDWIRLLFDRRPDLYHPHSDGEQHDEHVGPPTGARVSVLGERDAEGRLQVLALDVIRMPDVTAIAQALISPSPRKIAVILVNFSNNTAQPITQADARSTVFTGATSSNAYFKEISFGIRSLAGKVRTDGDVFGWYTIPSSDSPCDYAAWGTAARTAAKNAGVDLTGYNQIIHYFPKTSACWWGGVGMLPGAYSWINGRNDARVISHELGHNFGVHHASSLACTQDGTPVPISGNCTRSEYGNPFDVMGKGYYHMQGYHKGRLGWLESANVVTATGDGTFTIAPLEKKATGPQVLRVKVSTSLYYYVELRQPFGFDNFSATASVVNGVLINRATDYTSWFVRQPGLLDMAPGTTSFSDAALGVGKTFTDPAAGISIGVSGISSSGATVTVNVP